MAQTAAPMDKPAPPTPISTTPSTTLTAPPVPLRDTDSEGEGEVMLRLLSEATLESEERLSPKKRAGASRKRRSTAVTEPSPTPSPVSSQQQPSNASTAAKSNAAEDDDDAGGGDTEPEIDYEDSSPPKTRSSRLKRGSTTIGDFDSRMSKPMTSPQRPTRLVRHASDLSGVTRHSLDSPPLPGAPSMANINTPNLRRQSSSGNGRRTKITNLATLQEVLPLLNEEMLRRIIFQLALKDTDLLPELEKEVSRVYKTDSTDANENGLVSSPISADESSPIGDNKKRRRKNSEIEKNERCLYPSCSKSYSTKGALKQHMKIKHPNFNPPSLPSSSSSSSSSSLFSTPSPTPTPSPATSASALPLTSSMTSSSSSLGGSFTGGLSTSFAGAPSLMGTGSHSSPIIISPPSPAPTATGDHPSPAPSPLSGSSLSASMDISALEKKEHLASTVEKHTPDKVILVCKSQVEKLVNLASQLRQQQSTLTVSKDAGGSHSQPSSPSLPSTAPPASGLSSSMPPSTPNLKQYYDQIIKWLKVAYPVYKTAGRETDFFAYLQNLVIAHSGDATLANVVQTTFMRSRSSLSQSSQPMELSQSGLGLSATQSTMSVSQPGF